jgi:hypothetical protein
VQLFGELLAYFGRLLETCFNRSKFYSERNKEQIEVKECLLSFGAETFVFQVATQKRKDQDI